MIQIQIIKWKIIKIIHSTNFILLKILKFKNLIFLSLFTGLFYSSLFEYTFVASFRCKNGIKNFNIKTNGLNDSWNFNLEEFGHDMVININECIYIMESDYDRCLFGSCFYGNLSIKKYNDSRDLIWRINLDGLRVEESRITIDSKSNLYLASMYENYTIEKNMVLFKFNSLGDLQWNQTWEGDKHGYIVDIVIDSVDNIYVCGINSSSSLFIVKYNSTGNQQWHSTYEETNKHHYVWDMDIDSSNNIIIAGSTICFRNDSYSRTGWIRCYNQSGDFKWNFTNFKGDPYSITVDSADNVISINRTSILKFDKLGKLLWKWSHQIEFLWEVQITLDSFDNIYVATIVSIPEDHHTYDLYLIKINNSGNFDWYLTWGGKGDEDFKRIYIDSFNNIFLLSDHFLLKNPESNGKALTNIKLWRLYMILFSISLCISVISLYFILKHRTPKKFRAEMN